MHHLSCSKVALKQCFILYSMIKQILFTFTLTLQKIYYLINPHSNTVKVDFLFCWVWSQQDQILKIQ